MPGEPTQFSAFISYASPDHEKAEEICASLEARGFTCWIAPRNIRGGRDYPDEIIHGIENSRCLILVLSEAANESQFVRREVERAVSKRKPVFPFRIEEVLPSPSLELLVSTTQWLDAWSGPMSGHVEDLARYMSDEAVVKTATQASKKIARRRELPKLVLGVIGFMAIVAAIVVGNGLSKKLTPTPVTKPVVSNAPPRNTYSPVVTTSNPPSQVVTPPVQIVRVPVPAPIPAEVISKLTNAVLARLTNAAALTRVPPPAGQRTSERRSNTSSQRLLDALSAEGTELKILSAPDGQQVPPLFEIYNKAPPAKLAYVPVCPPETVAVKYTFDDAGYLVTTPETQRSRARVPFLIEDGFTSDHVNLILKTQDGTETGPFKYAVPDREQFILNALKTAFTTNIYRAIHCYLVPFSWPVDLPPRPSPPQFQNPRPANGTTYSQAQIDAQRDERNRIQQAYQAEKAEYDKAYQTRNRHGSALQALGHGNSRTTNLFVTSAPVVACIPQRSSRILPWAVIKEVRVGTAPGQTDKVIPVNVDWQDFLKTGTFLDKDLQTGSGEMAIAREWKLWNTTFPSGTKSVYAKFIYRDGSESEEVRFQVDETTIHE